MDQIQTTRCDDSRQLRWVSLAIVIAAVLILLEVTNILPITKNSMLEFELIVIIRITSVAMIFVGLSGCKGISPSFGIARVFAIFYLVFSLVQMIPTLMAHLGIQNRNIELIKLVIIPFVALFSSSLAYSILRPCSILCENNGLPTFCSVLCRLIMTLLIVFIVLTAIGDVLMIMPIKTIAFIDNLAWRTLFHRNAVYGVLLLLSGIAVFLAQLHTSSSWINTSDRMEFFENNADPAS